MIDSVKQVLKTTWPNASLVLLLANREFVGLLSWEAFRWYAALLGWIPAGVGSIVRCFFLKPFFGKAGRGLRIMENFVLEYPQGLTVGDNVRFNRDCNVYARGGVKIGDNVLIGNGVSIITANHDVKAYWMIDSPLVVKPIVISDGVWIGAHAVILPDVVLGEGCVVGAGAVVTKSVEPFAIVGGVPARVISKRFVEGVK
jgi:maltose O-acetyltransferase